MESARVNPTTSCATYRDHIKNAKPIGTFINPKFALLTFTLCCATDEEALAIQGPNVKRYVEDTR